MKDREDNVIRFKPKKKRLVAGVFLIVLVILIICLLTCFKIKNIEVTGNEYYTDQQIKDFVLSNGYIDNSILLMLKNKIRKGDTYPFIAKMDIEYVDPHSISITVYEKVLAGCIEYMNEYVYFDQDGYVLEISPTQIADVPTVAGLRFSSIELYEKLPVEDKDRFKMILKLSQLIKKYDLQIDSIKFTSENDIVLEHKKIRVELGDGSKLEEQMIDLNKMLDGLEGRKGILDLRDFNTASGKASFKEK